MMISTTHIIIKYIDIHMYSGIYLISQGYMVYFTLTTILLYYVYNYSITVWCML